MASPKKPAPLPTSATGGLGIDFTGLSELAGTLYSYRPRGDEVVNHIDRTVKRIARDARWEGTTAKAFTTAWERTATEAGNLAKFETAVGQVLDDLAVKIAWISDSYDRKCTAYEHGDPVDIDKEFSAHIHQAEQAEKAAAKQLVALYSGKDGGWSLESALKALTNDPDLSPQTRGDLKKGLAKIREDLSDQLPHKKGNSLVQDMMDDGGKGATVGGVVGGVIGAGVGALGLIGGPTAAASIPAGAIGGASAGGALGGLAGGIYGAFDHFF
ncbi:hypothetical protein ABT299_20605 [Spirillospora sp. NPDC000708]